MSWAYLFKTNDFVKVALKLIIKYGIYANSFAEKMVTHIFFSAKIPVN